MEDKKKKKIKSRESYEIGQKIDFDYDKLNESYPDSKRIFDIKNQYYITTYVSDIWEENNKLFVEIGLDNLQKSTLELSIVNKSALNFKFYMKEDNTYKFDEHIIDNTRYEKPNWKLVDEKIVFNIFDKKVIIPKKPFNIFIYDKNSNLIFELNKRKGFPWWGGYISPPLGFVQQGDKLNPFISFPISPTENFYGLGEIFSGVEKTRINKTIWNVGTSANSNNDLSYGAIPLIYSTKNWGILLNTGSKTYVDIGASTLDAGTFLSSDEYLDVYLFLGDSLKQLVSSYTELTGRIKGINDKAYGITLSRLYYHDKKEAQAELEKGKKDGFIVDVINIDPKWLKNRYNKSCNFEVHTERWGELKDFYQENLDRFNTSTTMWVNPYVQEDNGEFWKICKERNYLVKSKDSNELAHPWTGPEKFQKTNHIFDFSNPQAFEFWKNKLKTMAREGARFTVTDYGEGVPDNALFYNGLSGAKMRHYYIFLYKKATNQAFAEIYGEDNVMNLSRPGYIGSQRFPGKWSGDPLCSWSEMKNTLQAGLSVSMNGEVFWGSDIGGFLGMPSSDLLARWLQFGSFVPYTRFHGTGPREPWYYSKDLVVMAKKFTEIKRSWLPQYKAIEFEAIKTGLSIMRPLVMEFQDDLIARKIDDQYLIGKNILVNPIFEADTLSRDIYFPRGRWVDYFNPKKIIEGRTVKNIKTNISEIPVYIKLNSILLKFENGRYDFNKIEDCKLNIIFYSDGSPYKEKINLMINRKKLEIIVENKNKKPIVKVSGWKNYNLIYNKFNE